MEKTDENESILFQSQPQPVVSYSDTEIVISIFQLLQITYFLERLRLLDKLNNLPYPAPNIGFLYALQVTKKAFLEVNLQMAP
jgi:hypothetical protein